MRQRKYLFIGGPWDQQWHPVPESWGRIVRVADQPSEPLEFYSSIDGRVPQVVTYYGTRLRAPGWLVPLTIFTLHPLGANVMDRPMPGWVEGAQPYACSVDPDVPVWLAEAAEDLHEAIRARGCRP